MEYIGTLFLLFLVYSFIGWTIEVVGELIKHKKFVNRGFLIGPYCPIYGFGAIAITLNLTRYYNNLLVLFTMAILICGLLEYFTSFIMEKLFHARWWDYSNMKYNINGRICLETLVPFGILGVLIIQVLNPFFIHILNSIPDFITIVLAVPTMMSSFWGMNVELPFGASKFGFEILIGISVFVALIAFLWLKKKDMI